MIPIFKCFYQLIWFLICLILHRFFRTIYLPWLSCSATPSTGDWKLLAATSPETKYIMMTSSNGSIFRVTCPLCGEFIGHRSPHKGQWRGVLMFSSIWAWINRWVNNREDGDLRRHCTHYDVIVMIGSGFTAGYRYITVQNKSVFETVQRQ